MRDYLSTAASLDRNIGKTLDDIDQNGLTENMIVIYLSDLGFYMASMAGLISTGCTKNLSVR